MVDKGSHSDLTLPLQIHDILSEAIHKGSVCELDNMHVPSGPTSNALLVVYCTVSKSVKLNMALWLSANPYKRPMKPYIVDVWNWIYMDCGHVGVKLV